MKKTIWRVHHTATPPVINYCKKCKTKTNFISSGLFRINANRKSLDIWLVYRCEHCDCRWNMTVMTRIHPQSIPTDLLDQFHKNDERLAESYANNTVLVRENGGVLGSSPYEIMGESFDFSHPVKLDISSDIPSPIKVTKILRQKLGLSNNELDKFIEKKRIVSPSDRNIKKMILGTNVLLYVYPEGYL